MFSIAALTWSVVLTVVAGAAGTAVLVVFRVEVDFLGAGLVAGVADLL